MSATQRKPTSNTNVKKLGGDFTTTGNEKNSVSAFSTIGKLSYMLIVWSFDFSLPQNNFQ